MKSGHTILDRIMVDVRRELAEARKRRPLDELKRRIADAPPPHSMAEALRQSFGLIAEIKEHSPSQGAMRTENVAQAPQAYASSPIVRGLSVLTNATHFGMSIERLGAIRRITTKPILRKDFIFDEYQVYEARAFGADAILLMANLLEAEEMKRLHDLARSLGMEALFECHDLEQIRSVPAEAVLYGINSRTFATSEQAYQQAQQQRAAGRRQDLTTDLSRFEIGRHLPAHAVRIAESGVHPDNIDRVRALGIYHAVLVGTSLLTAPEGVEHALHQFERALGVDSPGQAACAWCSR